MCPFSAKQIDSVAQEFTKFVSGRKATAHESCIVVGQAIWNHQVMPSADPYPIGKLVIISVGIVQKAAFFDDKPTRIDARTIAAIPAVRSLPNQPRQRGDGPPNTLSLFRL